MKKSFNFPTTTGLISTKHSTKYLGWRKYMFILMRDHTLFLGEIKAPYWMYLHNFSNLIFRNHLSNFNQIWHTSFSKGDNWISFDEVLGSFIFLAHRSWKLDWAFVVRRPSVLLLTFHISISSFKSHWTSINQTYWHKPFFGEGDSSLLEWKTTPREDNNEIVEIHWRSEKFLFSRATGSNSAKLGTKDSWNVKGIQVGLNEGPSLFKGK